MTLQEACRLFQIQPETIRFYEESGLLQEQSGQGEKEYYEKDVQRVVQLSFLIKAGMEPETLCQFLQLQADPTLDTRTEQIQILRKCRCRLLEEIHGKQQWLDRLDYFIYQLKKQEP